MFFFGSCLINVRVWLILVVFICFGVVMMGSRGWVIGVKILFSVWENWFVFFMLIVDSGGELGYLVLIFDWKYFNLKFLLWLLMMVIIFIMLVYCWDWRNIDLVFCEGYLKVFEKLWKVDMMWLFLCCLYSFCWMVFGS